MRISVVLPSYNPDAKLPMVVDGLLAHGFDRIVVVNDGSQPDCQLFFDTVAAYPQCTLLTHEENRGKGSALKTAFSWILEHQSDSLGVVTVDGDDQHHPDDILAVANALKVGERAIVLGVRNFALPNVPLRSRLGNGFISHLFALVCGMRISDTQTGLRGIPMALLPSIIRLEGERFDYETNMLLALRPLDVKLREVPIRTIYIDKNATSHYRPFIDSLRIARLMASFFVSSLTCAAIDVGSYWMVFQLLLEHTLKQRVFWGTVISRVISSAANYLLNRKAVFKSCDTIGRSLPRYYTLCAVQMLLSYLLVFLLTAFFGGATVLAKLIVDTMLFFVSFHIQRDWVFRTKSRWK
ncbi:MAG: glycosyltransferase [Oscillospiraceae bacterium]